MTTPAERETEWEQSADGQSARRKRGLVRRRIDRTPEPPAEARGDRLVPEARDGARAGVDPAAAPSATPAATATPAGETPGARRVDEKGRQELASTQANRRSFLRTAAIGAGLLALGASVGFGGAEAVGLTGGNGTVITDREIDAQIIAGVRIATEFIPAPVPAGTDADPYPGSAIQAALNDGPVVFIPSGTWKLTATITRPSDSVTILGAGRSTKLLFDGVTPCISAGVQTGWLLANMATDAGGVNVAMASECRTTEIWVNGTLTDNRSLLGGGTGANGYYGARAADFVTQGDGSAANPYNASAIMSAINALPAMGGIVFVKSGIWRGNRITLGAPQGQNGWYKHILIMGEGADLSDMGRDGSSNAQSGTHVQCGFDIYQTAIVDFFNIQLSPHPSYFDTQPTLKYIRDPNVDSFNQWDRTTGGFMIQNVRFIHGHPALWITGQNLAIHGDVNQWWMVNLNHVTFEWGGTGLKFDNGDSTQGILRGDFRDIKFQHRDSVSGARAVDVQTTSIKGVWEDWLVEACALSADYAFYLDVASGLGGFFLFGLDFGDGNLSAKDAFLRSSVDGIRVEGLMHAKDVDIGGMGHYSVGRSAAFTGNFNILSGGTNLTIEQLPGWAFSPGAVSGDRTHIQFIRTPGLDPGFLGTITPTGSPYTYTNTDLCNEMVYLVGGTVTGVTRNGQDVGAELRHILGPGDAITIAYSAAPAIKRFALP